MRILFLNPAAGFGGAERTLLDILISVRVESPTDELYLIVGEDGPILEAARHAGINVHVLPMPKAMARIGDSGLRGGRITAALRLAGQLARGANGFRRYIRDLGKLIREINPDVVHSNGFKMHLLARWAAPKLLPIIWHIHDFVGARPLAGRLLKYARDRRTHVVAISKAIASDVHALLGDVPTETVYNAIDTNAFSPGLGDAAWLDGLAGFPPAAGIVRVGLISTYARWKGQGLFIESIARLIREHPDLHAYFFIIGGPIYSTTGSQFSVEELRGMARSAGLDGHIGFVPFQCEPASVYRALDVVVHASTSPEPFGRTVVEGMSCGRAVIVSRAGGAAELFEEGVNALGATPNDPAALSEAIFRLIADPALRQRLSAGGRESVLARFDRDRIGKVFVGIYRRLATIQSM